MSASLNELSRTPRTPAPVRAVVIETEEIAMPAEVFYLLKRGGGLQWAQIPNTETWALVSFSSKISAERYLKASPREEIRTASIGTVNPAKAKWTHYFHDGRFVKRAALVIAGLPFPRPGYTREPWMSDQEGLNLCLGRPLGREVSLPESIHCLADEREQLLSEWWENVRTAGGRYDLRLHYGCGCGGALICFSHHDFALYASGQAIYTRLGPLHVVLRVVSELPNRSYVIDGVSILLPESAGAR